MAEQARPVAPAVPMLARPLPSDAVRLTGGPLKNAQDLDAAYLLQLEPDRMLAFLRSRAGLTSKARGYGGWDGGRGTQLTGHIAGHYLSAVSLMYADTRSGEGLTKRTSMGIYPPCFFIVRAGKIASSGPESRRKTLLLSYASPLSSRTNWQA